MNAWFAWLAPWLLDFSLLATIVLALAIVLSACFRNPARRVALAWGTWLGLIALAVLTALPLWPRFAITSASYEPAAVAIEAPRDLILFPLEASAPAERIDTKTIEPRTPVVPPSEASAPGWRGALAIGWLALAGLTAAWFAIGLAQTQRLVRASETAPAWIEHELAKLVGRKQRLPGVRISRRMTTAAAVGALAPRILLPKEAECPSQQSFVRAALAHEWAHIRHGDLWLLAIERLLAPLLVWQPLWWWLRRGVRQDLELLADAAAAGDDPVEYAEALVAWAKSASAAPAGLAALSLWESPHTLSRRVTMLLDPKRSAVSRSSLGGQVLLACLALALIAALSLVTARPQSADAQEAQSASAEEAATKPAKEPAMIRIACVILEADREELAAVLPVERRWQPDPETDIRIVPPDSCESLVKQLAARPGTSILSRPQIQTLDGQMAYINIGRLQGLVPPADENSNAPKADIALGLVIELTPRVTKRPHNAAQSVTLAVELHQADLQHPPEGSGKIVKRNVATEAIVPVGQTVIIAHRPQKAELRPLVLAAHVFLVKREEQAGQVEPPVKAEPAELRRLSLQRIKDLLDDAQEAAAKPGEFSERELRGLLDRLKTLTQVEPAETTERLTAPLELRKVVSDLQHELLKRTREAEAQRSHSAALQAQVEALQAQLARLQGGTSEVQTFNLKYAAASKVSEVLKTYLEQLQQHSGDPRIDEIKVTPNVRLNAVHVSGPSKYFASVSAIVDKLDQRGGDDKPPVGEASANPEPAVNAAAGLSVDRQTQVELLKLDLQEAEIGLQAAQKDMDRVQSLRERGVISQEEVAKHEFQLQSAEIKVMRAKILLQGSMRQLLAPQDEPKPTQEGATPKPATSTPR